MGILSGVCLFGYRDLPLVLKKRVHAEVCVYK